MHPYWIMSGCMHEAGVGTKAESSREATDAKADAAAMAFWPAAVAKADAVDEAKGELKDGLPAAHAHRASASLIKDMKTSQHEISMQCGHSQEKHLRSMPVQGLPRVRRWSCCWPAQWPARKIACLSAAGLGC